MTDTQKRGRIFLLGAMSILGFLILNGAAQNALKGERISPDSVFGNGLLLFMLVLAFRGGRVSLKLAKAFTLLITGMYGVLLVIIAVSLWRGTPFLEARTLANTITVIPSLSGVLFTTWALFFSREVKDFIGHQREVACQRQLAKIKRSVALERSRCTADG